MDKHSAEKAINKRREVPALRRNCLGGILKSNISYINKKEKNKVKRFINACSGAMKVGTMMQESTSSRIMSLQSMILCCS